MTAIWIDLTEKSPSGTSFVETVVRGVFGDNISVVVAVPDPEEAMQKPIPDERFDPAVSATSTTVRMAPQEVARVVSEWEPSPAVFWCSFGFELPTTAGLSDRPVFRFGAPAPVARLVPVLTMAATRDRVRLRFGINGAPLLAPKRRTANMPEQTLLKALDGARGRIAGVLNRALEVASIRVAGDGVPVEELASAFSRLGKRIEIDQRSGTDGLLAHAISFAGSCAGCRHLNQGTADLTREGLMACRFAGPRVGDSASKCSVELRGRAELFAFEPFDGTNCTWGPDEVRFVDDNGGELEGP